MLSEEMDKRGKKQEPMYVVLQQRRSVGQFSLGKDHMSVK